MPRHTTGQPSTSCNRSAYRLRLSSLPGSNFRISKKQQESPFLGGNFRKSTLSIMPTLISIVRHSLHKVKLSVKLRKGAAASTLPKELCPILAHPLHKKP